MPRHRVARHLRPGAIGGPRVDQLPGDHRGAGGAHPRGGVRTCWPGRDFHLGYSPERIDPGNSDLEAREHTQGGVGNRRSVAPGRARRSTTGSSNGRSRCPGTREAELTKLLENTFRHVNIALVNELAMFAADLGHRRLGGHRRSLDQAVRLPAVHSRARGGRPLPSHRPELPVVEGAAQPRASRSGSWSWPTTSTSTCPTTWSAA